MGRNANARQDCNDHGFTIFDAGSGKVLEFASREQGMSAARALTACEDANDCFEVNDILNDAMPTVPDSNGVWNGAAYLLTPYGDDRAPAHLFPANQMFAAMPCDMSDYRSLEVIRDIWAGVRATQPNVVGGEFVCALGEYGASSVWREYAYSEQTYMNEWAQRTAEATAGQATKFIPETVVQMVDVFNEAMAAYRRAYKRQNKRDAVTVYAFMNMRITRDEAVEPLLREAAELTGTTFGVDEYDDEPSYGYLTMDSGNTELTCCAAGYLAAADVLRSHGIGCAPWAYWD